MRKRSCILALTVAGVVALLCSPVSAQPYSQRDFGAQVDVGIFYDSLSPYGEWVELPDYGWSWAPRVDRDWRPYTRGQWVMTDDGWFWDSDEEFGWAAYHYGRWADDPYYGWVWVPGTEWAPAWVSWRHGDGYTGWAPLPPRATWQARVGLSIGGLDIDAFIGVRDYTFVRDHAFMDRGVYQRVLPPTQNVTIINGTNNVTHYSVAGQRVVNVGIAVADVELAVGRPVPRARTVDVARADAPRSARAGEVAVFRPEVRAAPARRPAQGRSLVKGEAPPPLLVERRQEREQERQQKGSEPAVTAKDVVQRRPASQPGDKNQETAGQPQTPRADPKAQQQEVQRQSDQAQQDAARQRVKDQGQQKLDAQAQANKRAKDAQQPGNQQPGNQQPGNQQPADQQRAKQASDAQAQAERRAKDAQQPGNQQPGNQQQADQQRAKRDSDAQAQSGRGVKDAQPVAKDNSKDKGKKNPKPAPTPTPEAKKP